MVITFALVPLMGRMDNAPPPFSVDYVAGYFFFIPVALLILGWLFLGLPGLGALWRDKPRVAWLGVLSALVAWAGASYFWAFMRFTRPELALGAALGWVCVLLFLVVVACVRPPAKAVVLALLISMTLNGLVAAGQVAQQGDFGLRALGERQLDPQQSGVSVIQSGQMRWLRPYGFTPHSNILAGFMAVALLMTAALITSGRRRWRWWGTLLFLFGLWVLFLSFSRGAWMGFVAGGLFMLPLLLRGPLQNPVIRRHALLCAGLGLGTALLFFLLYRPLLLARAGVGGFEGLEARAINERVIFNNIAAAAVDEAFWQGVGAGNFPWYASHYLFYKTDLGMRGDNVHQVYLYAHAELGIIGLGLFVAALLLGIEVALRRYDGTAARAALLGGVVALAVIGLVDHYPWTFLHFQVLWWGLLVVAGADAGQAGQFGKQGQIAYNAVSFIFTGKIP